MRAPLLGFTGAAIGMMMLMAAGSGGAELSCGNPGREIYNRNPSACAPDGSRGVGLQVTVGGNLTPVPDTRCACLPIPARYNNFGALKTPAAGPWQGQVGKDSKGHAVFATTGDGLAAWALWIKRRTDGRPTTAFKLMSVYAPPDDCVGSIGTPPNCPFGINPTRDYAQKVAAAVGKTADDTLNLDARDCKEGRDALYAVFSQVATFEIGRKFCGGDCAIDREMFDTALDGAFGPVNFGPCTDSPAAHEG